MIRNCWHSVTLFVHRCLCFVGVHSAEKVFSFDQLDDTRQADYTSAGGEWRECGRLCAVCHKYWEETNV